MLAVDGGSHKQSQEERLEVLHSLLGHGSALECGKMAETATADEDGPLLLIQGGGHFELVSAAAIASTQEHDGDVLLDKEERQTQVRRSSW